MNLMDSALQANTPAVMVPRFQDFESLQTNGHRYLVAEDGLWLEVKRSWCHIIWPIAQHKLPVVLPFGKVKKKVFTEFSSLPLELLESFIAKAHTASPREIGAVLMWDATDRTFRMEECEPIKSEVGFLRAKWPQPRANESVAIDIHSHGEIAAYFSGQDRNDMGSNVVLACVVGSLNDPFPTISLPLCLGS